MARQAVVTVLATAVLLLLGVVCAQNQATFTYDLQHSFGDNRFSSRGSVTIKQQVLSRTLTAVVEGAPEFSSEELEMLAQPDALYTIRARSDPSNSNSPYIVASIPACLLLASGLQEQLNLQTDVRGHLLQMQFQVPSDVSCSQDANQVRATRVMSAATAHAPVVISTIPTGDASFGSSGVGVPVDPSSGAATGATEAEQPKKSFWSSWGMYIIPIMVVMMLFGGGGGGGDAPAGGGARRR